MASWGKPRQIGGLGRGAHTVSMSCCPIEVSEFKEAEAIPCYTSNDGEEPGKTVRPLALEGDKSKQHIKQHGRPKLPAYRMLGVTKEVTHFEGLLDLLEEGLDTPTASIQITDARSGPIEVVGQENHGDPFAVDLDPCLDSAQALRILPARLVSDQSDLVIADDVPFGAFEASPADTAAEVILGPGDPEDTASGQIEEVGKVNVGLVEDGDLSGLKPGAELHGAGVVMVGSFFDDGKARKERLQVQAKMHLGSSLTATVLGPVHAVGHQRNRRGIDRMDRPLEPAGQPTVTTGRAEPRTESLKMSEDRPEQFLHHVAVAVLVRVRERVTRWCNRPPDRSKFGSVVAKAVAHVVQSDRMGQLGEQKAHHVAPRSVGARLFVHAMLARKFFRQVRRDEFTKLMQCAAVVFGRRYCFHTSDSLVGIRRRPPFFIRTRPQP